MASAPTTSSHLSESSDSEEEGPPAKKPSLTDAQKAQIERNRQKALLLKQARLTSRKVNPTTTGYTVYLITCTCIMIFPFAIDTKSSFFKTALV